MPQFKLASTIYCSPKTAVDELAKVCARMTAREWTVDDNSVDLGESWVGGYVLAEQNPCTIIVSKDGGTSEQANADLLTALHETGNYSLAAAAVTTVDKLASGVENVLDHPGELGAGLGIGLGTVALLAAIGVGLYLYAGRKASGG